MSAIQSITENCNISKCCNITGIRDSLRKITENFNIEEVMVRAERRQFEGK